MLMEPLSLIIPKKNVKYMRAFLEAVLAYTKAEKVIVIGHSMGVTIGRKIIQGG